MMSATRKIAQDTPEDSEGSSYEETSEDLSAQTQLQQQTLSKTATQDAKIARADEAPRRSDIDMADRKKQATGELQLANAKESAQPDYNPLGRTASTRLTHTQSLQAGRKNSSYAQRQCDDLREKLEAAHFENNLLREKLKLIEENNMELIDQTNEVQKDKDDLDTALLTRDKTCKELIDKNQRLEDESKQNEIDQTNQKRENLRFFEQIQDLKDENKRLLSERNEFQDRYGTCYAQIERKHKEAVDLREEGSRYLYQRDEFRKQVEELQAENDRLTLSNANQKRRFQEAVEARAKAEDSESKFKDVARTWKNKYLKVTQEKKVEIQHCTKLVEEISKLRQENAIQDDESLQTDFTSFRYTVRDWCDRILECKPAGISAHFSGFPLDNDGPVVLTDLGDEELNVLIASVWEWLIKLVFGYREDSKDKPRHPDLWLENDKRLCLNSLEQYFGSRDPAAAIQWRYRTVQQLVECGLCNADQRFRETTEEIMKWITNCLQLADPTPQLEVLKLDFETQVLREAVNFALKLRRQNSAIDLIVPRSISRGLRSIALAKALKAAESEQSMVKVCVGPQMKKYVPQLGTRMAHEGVIFEAEFTDVPFQRWFPDGICSCNNGQQAEDIEVD